VSESAFPPFDEWLIDAADLLAEDDPGPTPYLVDDLIVEGDLIAGVGSWKTTKTYGLMEIAVSVRTGLPAFGRFAVPNPGPVVFVIEESGRAALWRRLDALCRGRGIDPQKLRGLALAANAGVKLDDPDWQKRLIDAGQMLRPRLFIFDPLARMKNSRRAENEQTDMADLIEFWRTLRDETGAAVEITHHSGHTGDHMRGTSDLETVWETRLRWERDKTSGVVTLTSEHREAEGGAPFKYRIVWDETTRTIRLAATDEGIRDRVRTYLAAHPDASANAVFEELGGNRQEVLDAVKAVKTEGGTNPLVPAGTGRPEHAPSAGTSDPLSSRREEGSGTGSEGAGTNPLVPAASADDLERARAFHAKHPPRPDLTSKEEEEL
jgi:hypothetical protein